MMGLRQRRRILLYGYLGSGFGCPRRGRWSLMGPIGAVGHHGRLLSGVQAVNLAVSMQKSLTTDSTDGTDHRGM